MITYFLIYRFQGRKSSDIVLANSKKPGDKGKKEIEEKLVMYRDKYGFNKPEDTLFIRKV